MPLIQIRASPEISEPIILATQADPEFLPLIVAVQGAVRAEVSFKYDRDHLDRQFHNCDTKPNWYVNSRVTGVEVLLDVEISGEELAVLERRHPTANQFVADGEQYQRDDLLAQRFADFICTAANRVLLQVRDLFGQDWVESLDPGAVAGNLLVDADSQWRPIGGEWQRVRLTPHKIVLDGWTLGVADQYLQPADWTQLTLAIGQQNADATGFSLLTDARRRFREGDVTVAVVQLNAAVEWAAGRFVHNRLATVVPAHSLKKVLKQNYERLLSDWVWPLVTENHVAIAPSDWEDVQSLRKIRNDIAHPGAPPLQLQRQEFNKLERAARRIIAALVSLSVPKAPPYFYAASGGGSL